MNYLCASILIIALSCASNCDNTFTQKNHTVTAGEYTSILVNPGDYYELTLANISSNTSFIIFQAHSQQQIINVSLTANWTRGSTKNASDVGLVTLLNQTETNVTWFLWLDANETKATTVYITATEYSRDDPVPGNCNQEFALQNDSNIMLVYDVYKTDIDFAEANVAASRRGHRHDPWCGNTSTQSLLRYHIYQYYMKEGALDEEEYRQSLQKMATVQSIRQNSILLKSIKYPAKTQVSLGSRPGQGVVYAVIVEQQGGATAAYVSAVTYACQFDSKVDNCFALNNVSTDVFCTIGGILGVFLCFLGHRFFKTEMFLFGFMAGALITFILMARFSSSSGTVQLVVTLIGGAVGGSLWLMFWCLCGIPILAVLLVGLVFGYIMTSVFFNATPLGNLSLWSTPFTYGMVFTCGVLLFPMFLLAFTKVLNIVSCGVVGSFAAMIAVDVFVRSNFSLIVISSIKKAIVPGFISSLVTVPFQLGDILLLVGWIVLAVAGCTVQFYRERKKPPFPPCPYQVYKFRRDSRLTMDPCQPTDTAVNAPHVDADTDPLLPHTNFTSESHNQNTSAQSQGHSKVTD